MSPRRLAVPTAVGTFLVTSCASFVSTPVAPLAGNSGPEPAADGIYYYMPTASIIVQVELDNTGAATATVPAVSAVPDRSKPYLLTVPPNFVSENRATLQINTNGLLQSAATVETSGVDTLVKNVAGSLGAISALAAGPEPIPAPAPPPPPLPPPPCDKSATYTHRINPEEHPQNKWEESVPIGTCTFKVEVTKLGAGSPITNSKKSGQFGVKQSGIFYKTQIPYLVKVTGPNGGQSFVAYSPNEAPVQFQPLSRTLFADNTTTFTLSDGVLTKADSDVHGEITGFVALPADAISAYMKAIGNIFDAFRTNTTNESGAALANAQWQVCKAAVAANPIQGVSATQAATNYAAIKAACSS